MSETPKCPLCKKYGLTTEMEVLWYDDGKRKIYRCKHPNFRHEICEHMLNATRKDLNNFSCGDCSADTIEDCQCFDCFAGVFCGECNSFVNIQCSDLAGIIDDNEEKARRSQ